MKTKKEEIDSKWIVEQNQNEGSCWSIFAEVSELSFQTAEASVMDICLGPYSLVGIISHFTDKQLCKKVMTFIKDQGPRGIYIYIKTTCLLQPLGTHVVYTFWFFLLGIWDFPGGSDGKASVYNTGDPGLIPGSGISPGEGNGNPLQYSCLENPMDRGAWQVAVHAVMKSRTRLSDFTFGYILVMRCKE